MHFVIFSALAVLAVLGVVFLAYFFTRNWLGTIELD